MTITPTRRFVRGLAAAGAGALAILTLSGCLSMTANLAIDSDAMATGSFAIGVQKQAASLLGMTDIDAFTSGITNPETTGDTGDLLSTGDCAATETDAEFVYTCSFAATAFTSDGTPWTITKSGDVITFRLVNQSTATDSSSELLQGGSLGDLTVNVTFPGEITSVTGDNVTKSSDTSITIASSMTDAVDVTVTSKATGAGASGSTVGKILMIVGIVILVIIVIALIAFLVMRRKKVEPAALAAEGAVPVVVGAVVEETVVETIADGTEVVEDTVIAETADGTTVIEEAATADVVLEDTVTEDQPDKGADQV